MSLALILAFFRSPLGQAVAIAAACALALGSLATCAYLKGRESEKPALHAAQDRAKAATAQNTVTAAAAVASDRASTTGLQAQSKAQEAAHVVEAQPGASAPLDPTLLASLRAQRCRVQHASVPAFDCPGGAEPAGQVPAGGR